MLSHIVYYNDDSLLIHCTETDLSLYKLEYFTEFYLFQAWTWRLTMLEIYVTLWGHWFVCVCVCACACVST